MEKEFTHIEPTDTCKQAAVHYMEDCQEVDDFVRRGIDEIAERYFCTGAEWMARRFSKLYAEKFLSMQVQEPIPESIQKVIDDHFWEML